METTHKYDFADGERSTSLAVKTSQPEGGVRAGFFWLGGFRSDMTGTKAEAMVDHAKSLGAGSVRFDYSGHGQSGGSFEDGTISKWVAQSLTVFRKFAREPQVLVGSSMGCWIALRLVQELQKLGESDRVAGLLLIAPAPDFTAELMEPAFTTAQQLEMLDNGFVSEPSAYTDEPNIITRALIEDGRDNLVFGSGLHINAPVRILQGMCDPDVPYSHAVKLVHELAHDGVVVTLIKDGDHRLSRPKDIDLLCRTLNSMLPEMSV